MLHERIREARKEAGLLIHELASRLKCSPRTVMRYEAGIYDPSFAMIRLIAKKTGADETWLLTGERRKVSA